MELREIHRDDSVNNWLMEDGHNNRPSRRSSQSETGEGNSFRRTREERPSERAFSPGQHTAGLLSPGPQVTRKPSLRGGPQAMLMTWSKKKDAQKMAEKSEEDRVMEALQTEISPRDIPERLSLKRQILRNTSTSTSLRYYGFNQRTTKKLGVFALAKYQIATAIDKVKRAIAEISPELWRSSIKSIEGQFGSGVGSYFKLLRLLLQVNVFIAIVSWCFLILPQIFMKQEDAGVSDMTTNSTDDFKPEDLLTFEGWMEKNLFLFYENYKNGTIESKYWIFDDRKYAMEPGYFYTILCSFIVYLLVVLISFLQSYRAKLKNGGQTTGKTYSKCVFTRWEMNVTDQQAANSLRGKITDDFLELLKKTGGRRKMKVPLEKKVIRGLLFLFSLAIIGGLLTGIVLLLEFEAKQGDDDSLKKISVSLVMAATFLLIPGIFDLFGRIENYDYQVKLYLGLFRMVLLTIGPVVIIVIKQYMLNTSKDGCPETRFGQEIYKLLFWSYVIGVLIINTILETIRNIVFRMGFKLIGAPQFDTGRNTMFLIYGQFLAWVGFYFSPMLPLVISVLLLFCFYIKQLSLYYNCSLSPKTWEGSTSKIVFYALTLMLFLTSLFFFFWVITEEHSEMCGPFRGIKPYDLKPISYLKVFITPQVIGFIDLVLVVLGFYSLSLASARRKRGKELRKQKKIEMEDLRFLRQELSVFYQSDGKLRI